MIVRVDSPASARRVMRWASRVLAIAGCAAIGYAGFFYLDGIAYQSFNVQDLEKPTLGDTETQPLVKVIARQAKPLGTVAIPRLGLSVAVSEGTGNAALRRGAGHISGTALPGSQGNVGIAGHRDTFFRPLRRIRTGDVITLTTRDGGARYVVEWAKVVAPSDVSVLKPTDDGALTLVTCYPFNFIGRAPERFIVRARKEF